MPRFRKLLFLLTAPVLTAGCVTVPSPDDFDALQRALISMEYARTEYIVQPGDEIRIAVYRGGAIAESYSGNVFVQPDGRISLIRLEQPIDTTGLSMQELQAKVHEAYYPIFASSAIGSDYRVTAQFLNTSKSLWLPDEVYVFGEVRRANVVPYRKGLTVLQAISAVGGWLPTAHYERTVVLRRTKEGRTVTREFNAEALIEHEGGDDLELFPGDVVFVPLTGIGVAGIWVDQWVRQMLPINPSGVIRAAAPN